MAGRTFPNIEDSHARRILKVCPDEPACFWGESFSSVSLKIVEFILAELCDFIKNSMKKVRSTLIEFQLIQFE